MLRQNRHPRKRPFGPLRTGLTRRPHMVFGLEAAPAAREEVRSR